MASVPVRQWVLSLPHRLRYLLAWDHECARFVRELKEAEEQEARETSEGLEAA